MERQPTCPTTWTRFTDPEDRFAAPDVPELNALSSQVTNLALAGRPFFPSHTESLKDRIYQPPNDSVLHTGATPAIYPAFTFASSLPTTTVAHSSSPVYACYYYEPNTVATVSHLAAIGGQLEEAAQNSASDIWTPTPEQRAYYLAQFLRLQCNPGDRLSGQQAKPFFELSKLPIHELSRIWELSDVDCDGQLTLPEFCVAMHLVVLRRNGLPLPSILPYSLLSVATANLLSASVQQQESAMGPDDEKKAVDDEGKKRQSLGLSAFLSPPMHARLQSNSNTPSPPVILGRPTRRWSVSSQSDLSSLADTMPTFDARLHSTAQLQHPVPLRARAFHFTPSAVDPLAPPVNGQTLVRLPSGTDTLNCKSFELHTAIPTEDHGLFAPPPPPRVHQLKGRPSPKSFHNATEKTVALNNISQPNPIARSHVADKVDGILDTGTKVSKWDSNSHMKPTSLLLHGVLPTESHTHTGGAENKLTVLRLHCDQLSNTNQHLADDLMKMQERRIALEILLERLMPIDSV